MHRSSYVTVRRSFKPRIIKKYLKKADLSAFVTNFIRQILRLIEYVSSLTSHGYPDRRQKNKSMEKGRLCLKQFELTIIAYYADDF